MPPAQVIRYPWPGARAGAALFALVLVSCAAQALAAPSPGQPGVGSRAGLALEDPPPAATPGQDQPLEEMPPLRPARPTSPKDSAKTGATETSDKDKEKDKSQESGKGTEIEEKQKPREPWFSVHGQGTIVTQIHDHFPSPYVGPLSLLPVEPSATTETATLFLDSRLWHGGELIFDPEISGGRGLSGTTGLAGFPNGEATRVGVVEPTPYIARLLVRQTWGLDGEREKIEDGPNQIGGLRDVNRFSISVGKMAATDVVDDNRYSHDPRTQFLNWSLMYNGAWDYPANVRGYTYGAALDFTTMFWALRYGIFAEPTVANGTALDPHILKAHGQILELEERFILGDHPGKVREWVFLNQAHMGSYRQSLAEMPIDPDITLTRSYRIKYGIGASLEKELSTDLGVFARIGWNDGQTESWAFTEIDETLAVGLQLKGRWWKRPQDQVGLAAVINGLSQAHRDYLAAGGVGFIIGDGRLNYAPEEILETYYDWELHKGIYVTADFQGVNHPAYNEDRGPVAIGSLRVHFEY